MTFEEEEKRRCCMLYLTFQHVILHCYNRTKYRTRTEKNVFFFFSIQVCICELTTYLISYWTQTALLRCLCSSICDLDLWDDTKVWWKYSLFFYKYINQWAWGGKKTLLKWLKMSVEGFFFLFFKCLFDWMRFFLCVFTFKAPLRYHSNPKVCTRPAQM